MKTFIPKEHPDIPDAYGIYIHFVSGRAADYEGTHSIINHDQQFPSLQIITYEDRFVLIPMCSIERIEFDKRFSKIVAIREKTNEQTEHKT